MTFNSASTLAATMDRARLISSDIHVVDSFSTDDTASIARRYGAEVTFHEFHNYGAQRNWASDTLPFANEWQLHLDADEWMNAQLIQAIQRLPENTPHNGFLIARYVRFLGRVLRHGAMSPTWHLRLFRARWARCEDRKYDQHFYLKHGTTAKLDGYMIDDNKMSLSEWTARHNRWSDAEAAETILAHTENRIVGNPTGNAIQRKRFWRERYNALPLLLRAYLLFTYRYFLRLGILDGKEGLLFWTLQTFWFRFLVDAKIIEQRKLAATETGPLLGHENRAT